LHAPVVGSVMGGAIGVSVLALIDTLRGYRLIHWLSGTLESQAPRDTGFWGEIGYRVERSIAAAKKAWSSSRRASRSSCPHGGFTNGVLLLDEGDQITWCNSIAADTSGWTRRETAASASPTSCVRRPSWPICSWRVRRAGTDP
jgi:two-component system phosphate regulon sensor histidine kinase PhoR